MTTAVPVLMYHHVSPNPGLVTVSPEIFEDHIRTLALSGWTSGGVEVIEALCEGKPVPAKTVVITFDDGYLDNYIYAYPILKKYGMKAVIFIATGWIGEGPCREGQPDTPSHRICKTKIQAGQADEVMLRWSEIEQMQEEGIVEFHSHTHTHTRWDLILSDRNQIQAKLREDLQRSRQSLTEHLGSCSKHLCWPQGYYDAGYKIVASNCGFEYLYTTEKQVNVTGADPQEIGRFVTKEKSGQWLRSRCWIYSRPILGHIYSLIRSH